MKVFDSLPAARAETLGADSHVYVVADIFRATSTLQILISNGCTVFPVGSSNVNEPPRAGAVRLGEWRGTLAPHAKTDNSPAAALSMRGLLVELVSTNGMNLATRLARLAPVAFLSLFNVEAVAAALASADASIVGVAAGAGPESRIEDEYAIGLLAAACARHGMTLGWEAQTKADWSSSVSREQLRSSPGAKFLARVGRLDDLEFIMAGTYSSSVVGYLNRSAEAVEIQS